ncbi:hypothetical protein ACFQS1_11515 [Paractinoplanes rhizophilus]|uniref:Prepilin-type N-terminal cleavage/methylation domain-containing protein n=1 Tax=Paractinoplanes rhizophilus TaxID=1416877 RepID=A0ABW2HPA1_9ACTN
MSDDAAATPADEGYSLIEVIVATGFMLMVLMMVAGGLSLIYSDFNRADELGNARDQIGNSFRRLDKELRYATWVKAGGPPGRPYYLKYATTTDCRQLVFKDHTLTLSKWAPASTTAGAPTTIATDLTAIEGIDPFTVYEPGQQPYATPNSEASGIGAGVGSEYELEHYQIRLRFLGQVGRTSLPLDVLFTAQNTTRNTPENNPCANGGLS